MIRIGFSYRPGFCLTQRKGRLLITLAQCQGLKYILNEEEEKEKKRARIWIGMCGDDIKNDPDQHQTCATSRLSISIYILYVNHRKSRKLFKYLHKLIIKIQHDTDPRLCEREHTDLLRTKQCRPGMFFSLQVPDTRHKYPILDTSDFHVPIQ